ncbi:hypothetical protein [Streptomyces gilvus]|uniref:hypothetical protein n=1 Tax=Streptomyces gilvus TaxID=2920937 RepID=UPI001F0E9887|nr:hypothetical protein [Streptomyces sp. CME 23]MCH5672870.1 hypothetical protein [Streptomyces sp. CME 23]
MLTVPALPDLALPGAGGRFSAAVRLEVGGEATTVHVERCAAGRLRDTYPVAAHDVEVRPDPHLHGPELSAVLGQLAAAIRVADGRCRRVVYAVDAPDPARVAAAEEAGFRYVVDVDVAGREHSLLVAEPGWVTATDMALERVPGS